eukprot:11277709-Heterocapsa_arctica.AAC.1
MTRPKRWRAAITMSENLACSVGVSSRPGPGSAPPATSGAATRASRSASRSTSVPSEAKSSKLSKAG